MVSEEPKQSLVDEQLKSNPVESGQSVESMFSPRFKSVAAMAGWDEEAILIASLIVEDTPERQFKHKKRSVLNFKTPPSTNSRRKRRDQRYSPISIPIPVLNLDEEEPARKEIEENKTDAKMVVNEENKIGGDELTNENPGVSCSNSALPCMDKLREELSCAICLEICFEPSTTSCGHSFCKKCLRYAADKCGKRCPKCRQLISNGRSCTVNTVLWNTIQLLFPEEVEARKAAGALNSREAKRQSAERRINTDLRSQSIRLSRVSTRDASARSRRVLVQDEEFALAQRSQREDLSQLISRSSAWRRRRATLSQDEDAALALRLQREEFMEAYRGTHEQSGTSLSLARANLRAMASRAINIRMRSRPI